MSNKYLFLVFTCAVLLLAVVAAPATSLSSSGSSSLAYKIDLSLLQPGDIILTRGKLASIIPGYYSHAILYIGNGMVVHAVSDGVVVQSIYDAISSDVSAVGIYRVKTSSYIKLAAVQWALSKVGYPYDYSWLVYPGGKQVYGSSYYCSELVWASYLAVGGPDLDANPGFTLKYGYNVAPQEIADDNDVYLVAFYSN